MKSGFVMLAGRSNVGKSTLLNALVGTKVTIVTPKPQTTRQPVRGILHDPRGQIVFVDTPGIFLGKKDKVSKRLNEYVKETLEGVDAIVYVIDPSREIGAEEEHIQKMLRAAPIPIIVAINKSDLTEKQRTHLATYRAVDVGQKGILEVSATTRLNLNRLVDELFRHIGEGDPHYPDLQLTDIRHTQWLEELIREKVFLRLKEELPYSIAVTLEDLKIRPDGSRMILGNIWTTDERYKKIIIGKGASMIKRISMDARKELEAVTSAKVHLTLGVKVDPKWQERFV